MGYISINKTFITIGNTRIRLSNIKNYGIYSYSYQAEPVKIHIASWSDFVDALSTPPDTPESLARTGHYLSIDTYQGDEFEFKEENDHDIYEAVELLDNHFDT